MSKIDLDRMIVRQTYFIPVKSPKLAEMVLKELDAFRAPVAGIKS